MARYIKRLAKVEAIRVAEVLDLVDGPRSEAVAVLPHWIMEATAAGKVKVAGRVALVFLYEGENGYKWSANGHRNEWIVRDETGFMQPMSELTFEKTYEPDPTCPNCEGRGYYAFQPENGEEYPAQCDACKGTGVA